MNAKRVCQLAGGGRRLETVRVPRVDGRHVVAAGQLAALELAFGRCDDFRRHADGHL